MTDRQLALDGIVLAVQVMPSVEEAAAAELFDTATKVGGGAATSFKSLCCVTPLS